MSDPDKLYSLYKGDAIQMVGTIEEIARWQGVEVKTARWYTYKRARTRGEDTLRAYAIDEMED